MNLKKIIAKLRIRPKVVNYSAPTTSNTVTIDVTPHNVTPDFVDSLKDNEIFVFGCRNSGRHMDGASIYALEHFDAIYGQREGRQGQSYAISTVGGSIGLKVIGQSVERFTQHAAEHPELHFLVTTVGCGRGGWHPQNIAPLFAVASKLSNVSLPLDFWNQRNKNSKTKCTEYHEEYHTIFIDRPKSPIKKILCRLIGLLNTIISYRILAMDYVVDNSRYHEFDLKEGMSLICPILSFHPYSEEYILNRKTKRVYKICNHSGKFQIKTEDIDWSSVKHLPEDVLNRIRNREVKYYSFGVFGKYRNGVIGIRWMVSPNGKTYYLDKYYGGSQTDEKEIILYGFIDTQCRFVVKMRVVPVSERENVLNEMRTEAENIAAKYAR